MKHALVPLAILLTLSGCAVTKEYSATGGSRSDGTIDLSYQYDVFQKPQVSEEQGAKIAIDKCRKWGYSEAEPFGSKLRNCLQQNAHGTCLLTQVVVKYQCLGNPEGQQLGGKNSNKKDSNQKTDS